MPTRDKSEYHDKKERNCYNGKGKNPATGGSVGSGRCAPFSVCRSNANSGAEGDRESSGRGRCAPHCTYRCPGSYEGARAHHSAGRTHHSAGSTHRRTRC
jgi:hypothetical protein